MEAKKCFLLLALGLVVLVASTSAMSIEAEPVKVTHRNSGPRYDIDRDEEPLVEDRSKLTPVVEQPQPPTDNKDVAEKPDEMPVGHIHIRRIFLVPMMHPMGRPDNSGWQSEDHREEASEQPARPLVDQRESSNEAPPMFAKPFWPFLTPARPAHHSHQHPHLFGADEASRSPTSGGAREQQDKASTNNVPATAAGGEREDQPARQDEPTQGMFDPIQMMMELMHQAMAGQLAPNQPPSDLNKEAATSDERPKSPAGSELAPAMKPAGQNETREDVVEIEGKKFLRKTVINRHVGENIIFMTKRLIFVPLNETEPTTTVASNEQPAIPTTTSTTERVNEEPTTTTTSITTAAATVDNKEVTEKPIEEATTTTTTTTTMAPSTEQPPTTVEVVIPDERPSSTPAAEVEATTKAKESWVDRVSDAIDKAAERMVESAQPEATTTTTTSKPSN